MPRDQHDDPNQSFRSLYPNLSEDMLVEASDRFDRYISLALAIYENVIANPAVHGQLRNLLTEEQGTNESE
jgi:hypothetical protein